MTLLGYWFAGMNMSVHIEPSQLTWLERLQMHCMRRIQQAASAAWRCGANAGDNSSNDLADCRIGILTVAQMRSHCYENEGSAYRWNIGGDAAALQHCRDSTRDSTAEAHGALPLAACVLADVDQRFL